MRLVILPLIARGVLATVILSILSSGCAKKEEVEIWTPQPRVHWEHVSLDPARPVSEGYRVLIPQPTRGFFPASMAVTRLAVEITDEQVQATRPYLLTDPRNEFLQWNRSLDDLMAISEVFPVVKRDLGGGEADPRQILAACRALHARFGLIYAVNELSETEAEMFGVLYNAASEEPVASIHARAVSVPPLPEEECDQPPDPWETDARALVRESFERRLQACVRELILQDTHETIEAPEGWTPAGPIRPVEWPPRHLRTNRRF